MLNNSFISQVNLETKPTPTTSSSGSTLGSTSGGTGGRSGDIKASKAQQDNMTVSKTLKGQVQYQKSKLKVARDEA